MAKTINAPTLSEVNSHLLEKLNAMVQNASTPEEILTLTESIAKLNTSMRNNNQFEKPENEDTRSEKERAATLAEVITG